MMTPRSRSDAAFTRSAALGPSPPMRMSSGPSWRNEKPRSRLIELHRRDAEIEQDAVDRVVTEAARDMFEIGEMVLDQREPALRLLDQAEAARHRVAVAVDADDARIAGFEDGARVPAGAERAVDDRCRRRAAPGAPAPGGRAREYDGPVRQRQ